MPFRACVPKIHACAAIAAALAVTACLAFVDLDVLGSERDATQSDAGAPTDAPLGDDADAGATDAPDRFCTAHSLASVCEDFDRGKGNPMFTWPAENAESELKIVTDASASAPASLFVSLKKGSAPNVKAYLIAASPSVGTKARAAFAFRPISTDYVIFAATECQAISGQWNRVVLALAPDGTIYLEHGNRENAIAIGSAGPDAFTDIELTMELGAGKVSGDVKIGTTPAVHYDRPVECRSGAGLRLRLGLEGAGGTAEVRFDNVVYDVRP